MDAVMNYCPSNRGDKRIRPGIHFKRNPNRTDVQKEKQIRQQVANATRTESSRNSFNLEMSNNPWDLQKDHRAGDHESSSMCIQPVAKNQEFDLVEGSIPSDTEKETVVQQEPV
jgi:hypothetical protein